MKSLVVKLLAREMALAQHSAVHRWLLSHLFRYVLPFSRPHRIAIQELSTCKSRVSIPLAGLNLNHLGGIHACALATGGEFASGLLALQLFPMSEYRIVCRRLSATYHRQARTAATATCSVSSSWLASLVEEIKATGSSCHVWTSEICDAEGTVVCHVEAEWHIKRLPKSVS